MHYFDFMIKTILFTYILILFDNLHFNDVIKKKKINN